MKVLRLTFIAAAAVVALASTRVVKAESDCQANLTRCQSECQATRGGVSCGRECIAEEMNCEDPSEQCEYVPGFDIVCGGASSTAPGGPGGGFTPP